MQVLSKLSSSKMLVNQRSKALISMRLLRMFSSETADVEWRSRAVFHDQAILQAFAGVCQALQMSKPTEETRRIGDEFVHKVQFDGSEMVFEARGRNKRTARKEAIRSLLKSISSELTLDARDEISFQAAQVLVLAYSKTGASSVNIRYELDSENNNECFVSFAEFESSGKGSSELIARINAFDNLIEQLESQNMQSKNDASSGAIAGSQIGAEANSLTLANKANSALRNSTMISRHNSVSQKLRQNTDFHYETVQAGGELSDGSKIPEGHTFQCTVVWSDGQFAEGTGKSKNQAKGRACEKMLVQREVIERTLTEEELALADNPSGPEVLATLPPPSWELFLPSMWKEEPNACINHLVERTPEQGYMSIELWEQLLNDTSSRGANEHFTEAMSNDGMDENEITMQKKQEMRDLCRVKVEGEFLNEGGAAYFHKWRGYLGIEEHAMYESGKDLVEDLGPFQIHDTNNWPYMKLHGAACDGLHTDDLLLIRGRPCRVTALKKPSDGDPSGNCTVRLLDPRDDDGDLFQQDSDAWAVQFGMAIPSERMVRALKSFSGYQPPPYESQQPVPVAEWLQNVLINPTGIGFGSDFDHTSEISSPVEPLESIPLSDSQKDALKAATSRRLTLIQGPPGTGKSHTGAAIVCSYVNANPQARILACADSNIAADNLCRKIQAQMPEARVIRVGDGGADDLRYQVLENEGQNIGSYNARELRLLRMEAVRRQLPQAQVVVATCIGSGMESMEQAGNYDFCVIDEASQALEPATLVALERAGPEVKHVVLIGDHKQLPATVLSNDPNIGVSLFQRMADRGVDPLMLLEQRRMHSLIAEFPNETFYNGRLENATNDAELTPVGDNTVELMHIAPKDINGNEVKRGESTCNQEEAVALCNYLEKFVDREDISIGVLTPYAAQKRLINDMLFELGLLRDHIRVDTIDGFQGMEKDIILFSATRSNPRGDIGFLKDPRRMNVMLTRAKRSLVVFADASTLRSSYGGHWARWVSFVEDKGVVSGDELPSAMSSNWSGRQRDDESVDYTSAFGGQGSDSNPEESDFLKMLKAGEASFHSGNVNVSNLPNATTTDSPMFENDPTKIGRQAIKQDDPETRKKILSKEEFDKLLEDEDFGGSTEIKPKVDTEFLDMLDKCVANNQTKGAS